MRYTRLPSNSIPIRLLGICFGFLFVTSTLYPHNEEYEEMKNTLHRVAVEQARRTHFAIITEFLKGRETWATSILGSWLFKYDTYVVRQNKTFTIHVNKYSLGSNPLEGCSVKNCIFTGDDRKLSTVDAVLVHLHRGIIPKANHRNPRQRWIFLSDESPKHTFTLSRKRVYLEDLANIFNWSMTYRSDADIPKTYGRTVPLDEPVFRTFDTNAVTEIIPKWQRKRRDVLATILISNCMSFRMAFIRNLQKYIPVDVYGSCSNNKTLKFRCPGHIRKDCDIISEYLFYLAIENSDCREYLTEKIWYNAYMKGAIPIIVGPSLSDCRRILPPNSFLHISAAYNITKLEELAKFMIQVSEDDDLLLSLHQWRNHFVVINEHGYFGTESTRLCRVCEGLNYNDVGKKIYSEDDIRRFLDPKMSCGKNNT